MENHGTSIKYKLRFLNSVHPFVPPGPRDLPYNKVFYQVVLKRFMCLVAMELDSVKTEHFHHQMAHLTVLAKTLATQGVPNMFKEPQQCCLGPVGNTESKFSIPIC